MRVCIHQPSYLPWLGLLHRISQCDIYICLNHVQFEKNSFINRNKIKGPQGSQWLTVPVLTKHKFGDLSISKIQINHQASWVNKHRKAIELSYRGSPYFKEVYPLLMQLYDNQYSGLSELCIDSMKMMTERLNLKAQWILSSSLQPDQSKSSLVLELCSKVGATEYLSGPLGRNYLVEKDFHDAGIEIRYQNFTSPRYQQLFGDFIPNLSAIDFFFNQGFSRFHSIEQETEQSSSR